MSFALTLVPLVGLVGAAVDYSRANSIKSAMQAGLDATALSMSKTASSMTGAKLQQKSTSYFKAVFNRPEAGNIQIATQYSPQSSTLTVNGTAQMKTEFLRLLGFPQLTVTGTSTASWGLLKLRIALVLDNTGSMADSGKLVALKSASHSLLAMLQSAATNPGDIQVAIIPFASGVNVGTNNVNEPWLDWTYFSNSGGSGWSNGGYGSGGVNYGAGSGAWDNNGSWSGGGASCTWSTCWSTSGGWSSSSTTTNKSHWQGCVMDRDQDYDVRNTPPTSSIKSTLYPTNYNSACPAPMMALGNDWTALNAEIDSMIATGSTNQTIGLAWGWQALTPGEPFDNPPVPAGYAQVMVLLTDGLNTENRWSTNQATIDARTAKVCNNIKSAGITLYTVQVNTAGDPTSALLQTCASTPDKFFLLTSSNQIVTTFNSIGTSLSKLRLAR